jgi:hypothetical protein
LSDTSSQRGPNESTRVSDDPDCVDDGCTCRNSVVKKLKQERSRLLKQIYSLQNEFMFLSIAGGLISALIVTLLLFLMGLML